MQQEDFLKSQYIDIEPAFDEQSVPIKNNKIWNTMISFKTRNNEPVIVLSNFISGKKLVWPDGLSQAGQEELDELMAYLCLDMGQSNDASRDEDDFESDLANGFFKEVEKGKGRLVDQPDYNRLAQYFRDALCYREAEEGSYIFEDGYYRVCGGKELSKRIEDLTLGKCEPWQYNMFKQKIYAMCFTRDLKQIPIDGLLNLKNGVLNVKTRKMLPHSHKYFFRYKLDHDYSQGADGKLFSQFLFTSFRGDEKLRDLIGEIMGYTLMGGDPKAHRAFVFYGEGRNGKSTLLSTIRALLGHTAVASVSLKNLDKPFSMVQLDGKLANIVDESPNKIDPEGFKNVVGGGFVTAAQKGKPEYDLKVNARLIFACNKMPNFGESGVAIKDRLIFVPFEKYLKEQDRDINLESKLKNPIEMSGILNFALDGLDRFLERGFTKSKEVDKLKEEYEEESDPVLFWANERITYDGSSNSFMPTDNAFHDYLNYCRANNMNAMGKPPFGKRLKSAIRTLVHRVSEEIEYEKLYKDNTNSGTGRGWKGFKLAVDPVDNVTQFNNRT